jgi:hypothetical protein
MRNIFRVLLLLLMLSSAGRNAQAEAVNGLALSISPPLFKVELDPGQAWASMVKVVNNNPYEMTVFAQVLDFKSGAQGGVEFISNEIIRTATATEKFALSQWVNITDQPIKVAPFGSQEVIFSIATPPNAAPGGHYAAIMIGTQPPSKSDSGSNIKVSSKLASLILARVSGEVVEQADIKEFSASRYFSADLKNKLSVIFENSGNTHLRPRGEITVYNIFGQKRRSILINNLADYGNVLPNSTKRWEFDWQGESSLFDAGLLRADLNMNYGEDDKQSLVRSISFWSFDLKPTLVVIAVIFVPLILIVLLIRLYIKHSIASIRSQVAPKPVRRQTKR